MPRKPSWSEDAGTVTLTLTASAPSTAAYTIDYETEDGTAVAGTDYTAASGTVRFRALETERTIAIAVLEDTVDEELGILHGEAGRAIPQAGQSGHQSPAARADRGGNRAAAGGMWTRRRWRACTRVSR